MNYSKLFLFLGLISSTAANAGQFKCAEKAADAVAQNRVQYAVFVSSVERITDPVVVGDNDFAEKVRVSVLSRDPSVAGSKFRLERATFEAVATSEDVMYNIKAWKRQGFEMGIYMDELDQTWVKLAGLRKSLRMNCSSK